VLAASLSIVVVSLLRGCCISGLSLELEQEIHTHLPTHPQSSNQSFERPNSQSINQSNERTKVRMAARLAAGQIAQLKRTYLARSAIYANDDH